MRNSSAAAGCRSRARRLRHAESAEPLVRLLRDAPEPTVRAAAIEALGRLHEPVAIAALTTLLGDTEEPGQLRARAAWALGEIGASIPAAPLLAALNDPIEAVRRQAANALGSLASTEVIAALGSTVVNDTSTDVVQTAVAALGRIGAPAAQTLVSILPTITGHTQVAVAAELRNCPGTDVIETLSQLLTSGNPPLCQAAVVALATLGGTQCLEPLGAALALWPTTSTTITTALQGLAAIGNDRAAEIVLSFYARISCFGPAHDQARAAINTIANSPHASRSDD